VPTPPPPPPPPPPPTATTDEQPTVYVEEKEEETKVIDEKVETNIVDEQEETIQPKNNDKQDESDINIEDSTQLPPINNQVDDTTTIVHSRPASPRNEEQPSTQIQPILSELNITGNLNSPTAPITPTESSIRIEISDRSKVFSQLVQPIPKLRKGRISVPLPPAPPPSSQQPRLRKQGTGLYNRSSNRTVVSDQSTDKRYFKFYTYFSFIYFFFFSSSLLPNTSNMWDSYEKQTGI
jgi:hypothetical protein